LEWNLKITTKEVGHIIEKFQKTFDSYWHSSEFELFSEKESGERLKLALSEGKKTSTSNLLFYFDLRPEHFQLEILEQLEVERTVHNCYKNLIVAATGTGKTIISAFDFKRFLKERKKTKLLFVAHRKEILQQALATFRAVLKDQNFGELWVDGEEPTQWEHIFASVQTINSRFNSFNLNKEHFDFIVIDEVHHISAKSYRPILNSFQPIILLGLTATPERQDGESIIDDFEGRIAAEIRLPEALNRKLLCPFQYFGISDSIDLSHARWERGKYVPAELTQIFLQNDIRVGEVINAMEKYLRDIHDVRALGFCISIEHASYMADKFMLAGLRAGFLTANNSQDRELLRQKLRKKEINYLFVVDIFNEGIDIPEIDTVLFLRPTESLTIFLQQLGRGLRLAEGKECLTVLDFVGNSRPEYDFEGKFRALIGKTETPLHKEIEENFPRLPLGCSIILEKVAKERILENIRRATSYRANEIINKIRNFKHQTSLPFSLKNFLLLNRIPIQTIYNRGGWSNLCASADVIPRYSTQYEREIVSGIKNKWLQTNSLTYFKFVEKIAKMGFKVNLSEFSEEEKLMATMLHYDIWAEANRFGTLEESLRTIGCIPQMVCEIIDVLEVLIDRIDFHEYKIQLPFSMPLRVHGRYTREQIVVALQKSDLTKAYPSLEGVLENKALNVEALFINLIKSEEDFSPTTLYHDYAISSDEFHWQTQNSARPDKGKGLSYIGHKAKGKRILLFVREQKKDEFKQSMGYVFVGEGSYVSHYGSKPMSITWKLSHELPPYLWKASAKFLAG